VGLAGCGESDHIDFIVTKAGEGKTGHKGWDKIRPAVRVPWNA
jgi:hypothetical protein